MEKQKGLAPILIVILIAVAVGGYLLYQKQLKSVPVVRSSPSPVISPAASSSVDTFNWKTYTSSKANYSFKYPTEWPVIVVPVSSGCDTCVEDINFSPSYNQNSGDTTLGIISVYKEAKIRSLDDYVNIHVKGDESKVSLNYTTLGGEKAVSYKLSGGIPPLPIIEYAVVKNGYQYILRIEDSKGTNKNRVKNIQIFNQILSTFKFTDQNQTVDTSNWKTYTNSDYTFKYPSNWEEDNNIESGGPIFRPIDKSSICGIRVIGPITINSSVPLADAYKVSNSTLVSRTDILVGDKKAISQIYYTKSNSTLTREVIVKDPKKPVSTTNTSDISTPVLLQILSSFVTKNVQDKQCESIFNQILSTFKFTQ